MVVADLTPELVERCILGGMLANSTMPCGTIAGTLCSRKGMNFIFLERLATLPGIRGGDEFTSRSKKRILRW